MAEKDLKPYVFACFGVIVLLGLVVVYFLLGRNTSLFVTSPKITVSGGTLSVQAPTGSVSFTIQGPAYLTGRIYNFLPFTAGSQYANPALVYVEDSDYRQVLAGYKQSKTLPTRTFGRFTKTVSLLTSKPEQLDILEKLAKKKRGSLFTITGKFLGIQEMAAMGMKMPLSDMQALMDQRPGELATKIVFVETLKITEATPDLIWQDDYPSLDPMTDQFLKMTK